MVIPPPIDEGGGPNSMLIILTSSDPHDTVKLVKLDDCGGGEGEVGGGGRATPVENSRLIGDPPVNKKIEINIYTIAIARVSAL